MSSTSTLLSLCPCMHARSTQGTTRIRCLEDDRAREAQQLILMRKIMMRNDDDDVVTCGWLLCTWWGTQCHGFLVLRMHMRNISPTAPHPACQVTAAFAASSSAALHKMPIDLIIWQG